MKVSRIQLRGRALRQVAQIRQPSPIGFSAFHKRGFVHRLVLQCTARILLAALLLTACLYAIAETKVVEGSILDISDHGFVLNVGTQPLAVEQGFETRFWNGKAQVKREAFKVGDRVFARVKTDADPPQLKELADKTTWEWLDRIRKEPQEGTIEKVDDRFVTLKLVDGSQFQYRSTAKTQVQLKDKAGASTADLTVGQRVWAKGRTLPSLDTWLVSVSDTPITGPAKKVAGHKRQKTKPLASSGKLNGTVLALIKPVKMFDVLVGISTLHITYDAETRFYLDGKPAHADDMRRNMEFSATYRRDKYGRIIASKVELFSHPRT